MYLTDGQVMVPGIDLADHNPNPTCHLIQDRNNTFFSLIANKKIEIGDSLTINYGPLSSDELLSDYGFTVDENPYDKMLVNCDYNLINTARLIMGQGINNNHQEDSGSFIPTSISNILSNSNSDSTPSIFSPESSSSSRISSSSIIGRGGSKLDDRWLHQWQVSLIRYCVLV